MRILTLALLALAPVGCSPVEAIGDAAPGTIDSATVDGAPGDGGVDAPAIDAPTGPTPRLHWTFDGNLDNTGSLAGYTAITPSGVFFTTGKLDKAAMFGGGQYAQIDGMRGVLGTYAKATISFWLNEPGAVNSLAIVDCLNRSTSPYGGIQLGLSANTAPLCVATANNSLLDGSCGAATAPPSGTWHHWILRYDGVGLAAGQGGATTVWIDGVLAHTQANDNANNPVLTPAIPDRLYLGAGGIQLDDVRVYDQVFTPKEQCEWLIGGMYTGTTCSPP